MQHIEKIGQSFWYLTPVSETDRPILGLVTGKYKSLMIDAGNSENHANLFLAMLSKQKISEPDFIVLTHWHWDHIFGLSAYKNSISISSIETKQEIEKLLPLTWSDDALAQRVKEGTEIEFCANCIKEEFGQDRDIKVIPPSVTFYKQMEVDLGGITCILEHVGGDHASDSIIIFIKEEKILFLGDSIYPDIFSTKRNYTVEKTLNLLEKLEKYDAETYILSHWKPITKSEYLQEANLLKNVAQYTKDYAGNYVTIKEKLEHELGRNLNEDELETIEYFVNGFEMNGSK